MTITAASLAVEFSATGVSDVTRAVDTVDQKVKGAANSTKAATQAAGLALGGIATAAAVGFGKAVGLVVDFDKQISGIASVGGQDALKNIDAIRQQAIQLGADTAFSASEAAQGMEELIKAGLPVKDVLDGAAAAALNLAAATGTAVPESATIMSNILNVFSDTMTGFATQGDKAVHVADLLTQVANASAADVSQLGLSFSQAGSVARQFGVDVDTLGTALGILANNGLKSSDAGTSLKQMFLSLANFSKPAIAALKSIGLDSTSFTNAQGQFVGIEQTFDILRTAMQKTGVTAQETNSILGKIFGSDATRVASVFLRTTSMNWDEMRHSMGLAGTASDQAKIRLDNLAGDLEQLRGSVQSAQIAFLEFSQGPLRLIVQAATKVVNFFTSLPAPIQQTIAILAGMETAIFAVVGAWAAFGDKIMLAIKGMALLTPPILAVTAALGALYLAYKTNFLGFADGVQHAVARLKDAFGGIQAFFKQIQQSIGNNLKRGLSPVEAILRSFRHRLIGAFGKDNPLAGLITNIIQGGRQLQRFFDRNLRPLFDELGTMVQHAVAGFQSGGLGGAIGAIFADLPDLGGLLANVIRKAGPPVIAAVSALIDAVGGALRDRFGQIVAGLPGVLAPIGAALLAALRALPQTIADAAPAIWEAIKGLGGQIADALGSALAAITPTVSQKFFELQDWLRGEGLAGVISAMIQAGARLIGGLVQGLVQQGSAPPNFFGDTLIPAILNVMAALPTLLIDAGIGLIKGLLQGIQETWWNQARPWLLSVEPDIVAALGNVAGLLLQAGKDIITGLLLGMQDAYNGLAVWLQSASNAIGGIFNQAGAAMSAAGTALIAWFQHGAQDVWNNQLGPFLQSIPQQIINMFGNAKDWLFNAGASMITGLMDGIGSKLGDLQKYMQDNVTNKIPQWKGPPAKDRQLLHPAGQMIMQGLAAGMQTGLQQSVLPFAQGVGPQLAGAVGTPQLSGFGAAPMRARPHGGHAASPLRGATYGAPAVRPLGAPAGGGGGLNFTINVTAGDGADAIAQTVVRQIQAAMARQAAGRGGA